MAAFPTTIRSAEDTFYVQFTTDIAGVPTVLSGAPVVSAYEDDGTTEITAGVTLGVDHDGVVGLNLLTIAALGANGFENGKDYALVITTGTAGVAGPSRVGTVVGRFRLEAPPQIATTGSAVNVVALASPGGFVLTTGSEVNNEDSTQALDGVYHELSDAAGVLEGLYKFDIKGNGIPVRVQITGVFNSNNDSWGVYANVGSTGSPAWQQVGTINGTNGSGNVVHGFDMLSNQVVTDVVGEVQIRINGTGLTSSSFDVDQIIVSHAVVNTLEVYELGRLWFDSNASNTNTEPGVDGTAGNPVSTMAAIVTLAASTGLTDVHVLNGSLVTLGADMSNFSFFGDQWDFDLNGQIVTGVYVEGARDVIGTGVAASECKFAGVEFGSMTLHRMHGDKIGFRGTLTIDVASENNWHFCYSKGVIPPVFAKTAGQAITHEFIGYEGDITINGLESGDTIELGGNFRTIIVNGADATVHVHGTYQTLTDNMTGTSVDVTGAIKNSDVADILADTAVIANLPTVTQLNVRTLSAALIAIQTALLNGAITGGVTSGAPTTTVIPTDLSETEVDQYLGRTMILLDGALAGQATEIGAYDGAGELTVTATTSAVASGVAFIIV